MNKTEILMRTEVLKNGVRYEVLYKEAGKDVPYWSRFVEFTGGKRGGAAAFHPAGPAFSAVAKEQEARARELREVLRSKS